MPNISLGLGLSRQRRRLQGNSTPYTGVGQVLALEVMGGTVTADTGFAPNVSGIVVRVKFKGMGRRSPHGNKYGGFNDPVTDATKLTLVVQDAGFDGPNSPVTWERTVVGTQPLKNPFPATWGTIGATVPALSWCSNLGIAYFTVAGGTKGGVPPTGTTIGTAYSDGGVSWICIGNGPVGGTATVNTAGDNGYIEAVSGSDVWVYMTVDQPIYSSSTVVSATMGAGCYSAAGTTSHGGSIDSITNGSTLDVPQVVANHVTPDHQLAQGAGRFETYAAHYWGPLNGLLRNASGGAPAAGKQQIAGVRFQTYLAATPGTVVNTDVSTSSLSTLLTTAGPGGCAVDVFGYDPATDLASAGDAYIEAIYYPWIGSAFSTSTYGEGSSWAGSTNYAALPWFGVGTVVRNGSNFYYLTTAGTSASSGGPTGVGTAIADGSCVWDYYGNILTGRISRNLPARSHFYNDPSSLYKRGYCFVDPSGTATTTAAVYSSYAAALAASSNLANCFPTIGAAAAQLPAYHNTAGGGLTTHNDTGGGMIYCKAGTHSGVGTSMASLARGATWLTVKADPTASPGTVVFSEGAVKAGSTRMWFGNGISFTGTTNNIGLDSGAGGAVVQSVIETVIQGMNITYLTGNINEFANRCGTFWYIGNTFTTRVNAQALISNGSTMVGFHGNNFTGSTASSTRASFALGNRLGMGNVLSEPVTQTNAPPLTNHIVGHNKMFGRTDETATIMVSLWTGTVAKAGRAFIGNLVVTRRTAQKCGQIAADASTTDVTSGIIAHNSFVGARFNFGYNDPSGPYGPLRQNICYAQNISTMENFAYDSVNHVGIPSGLCCQNYSVVYRVGHRQNVNLRGSTTGAGYGFFSLLGFMDATVYTWMGKYNQYGSDLAASAEFMADNSAISASPSHATDGDYRPILAGVSVGAASWLGLRYDLNGVARVNTPGALEAA